MIAKCCWIVGDYTVNAKFGKPASRRSRISRLKDAYGMANFTSVLNIKELKVCQTVFDSVKY